MPLPPPALFLTHLEAALPPHLPSSALHTLAPLHKLHRRTVRVIFAALEEAWFELTGEYSPSPPLTEMLLAPAVTAEEALGVYLDFVGEVGVGLATIEEEEEMDIEEGFEEGEVVEEETEEGYYLEADAYYHEEDAYCPQEDDMALEETEESYYPEEDWEMAPEDSAEDEEPNHPEEAGEIAPEDVDEEEHAECERIKELVGIKDAATYGTATLITEPITPPIAEVPTESSATPSTTADDNHDHDDATLRFSPAITGLAAMSSTEAQYTEPTYVRPEADNEPLIKITITDVDDLRANPAIADLTSKLDALLSQPLDLAGSLRIRDHAVAYTKPLEAEPWLKVDWPVSSTPMAAKVLEEGEKEWMGSLGRFFSKVKKRASL